MAMELPRMGDSVLRVISLDTDESGAIRPVTLYDKGKKKSKKQSAPLKAMGRAMRRRHEANLRFEKAYIGRHKKSNAKRRDGWARDLPVNLLRADEKGRRKIKLI